MRFFVGADLFEGVRCQPETKAGSALQDFLFSDCYNLHFGATTWTMFTCRYIGVSAVGSGATARTMLSADEHHREAGWTSDGRELGFAVATLRRVG